MFHSHWTGFWTLPLPEKTDLESFRNLIVEFSLRRDLREDLTLCKGSTHCKGRTCCTAWIRCKGWTRRKDSIRCKVCCTSRTYCKGSTPCKSRTCCNGRIRCNNHCGAPDNVSLAEPAAKIGHAAKERHAANIELMCLRLLWLRLLLCAHSRLYHGGAECSLCSFTTARR